MYNENSNFSIKNVILEFLFVALFIFILIWLFPLKSDLTNAINDIEVKGTDISVLTDRIFNENIISMKDAAKSYYTTPRLPKNVGDKVKMTLGEMLDKKIILPFTDKNGEACDTRASYVEITKYDDEFIMKVNLKCGSEENYLLVYMGCYDYCATALCEKHTADVKAPVVYKAQPQPQQTKVVTEKIVERVVEKVVTNNNIINNNNVINNNVVINNIIVISPENPKCAIKDGKYYDKDGKETTKAIYEEQCVVKPENPKCAIKDGKYYDKNGNETTKAIYEQQCVKKPENPKCAIKDGKYYDKNGNETTKAEYEKQCVKKDVEYLYEYKKTTAGYYKESDWSAWSKTAVTATSTRAVRIKTVKEKKLVGYNVKKATDYNSPIYGTKVVNTGTEKILVCNKWDYVPSGTKKVSNGEWNYVGLVTLYSVPTNTSTVKYEFVRFTDETCKESCSSTTGMIYKKYTVGSASVNLSTYECVSSGYKTITLSTTVKTIIGYNTKEVSREPVYKEVETKYYSYKTRTWVPGTTDIKWSKYNDTALLSAGYVYTGNKKVKQ